MRSSMPYNVVSVSVIWACVCWLAVCHQAHNWPNQINHSNIAFISSAWLWVCFYVLMCLAHLAFNEQHQKLNEMKAFCYVEGARMFFFKFCVAAIEVVFLLWFCLGKQQRNQIIYWMKFFENIWFVFLFKYKIFEKNESTFHKLCHKNCNFSEYKSEISFFSITKWNKSIAATIFASMANLFFSKIFRT